jgi:hypothetical protein
MQDILMKDTLIDRKGKNQTYLLLTGILFIAIRLLNFQPKLAICAFLYVLITSTLIIIVELNGRKKALYSILLSMLGYVLMPGSAINMLIIASFASVLVSTYLGIHLFIRLRPILSLPLRALVTLVSSAIVDTVLVSSCLFSKFSLKKVLFIGLKDMSFKFTYSLIASLCLFLAFYLFKQMQAYYSYKSKKMVLSSLSLSK